MDGNSVSRHGDDAIELEDEPPLDVSALDSTWSERLTGKLFQPWIFRLLRAVNPTIKLNGLRFVLRYDDVRIVLDQDRVFHVEGDNIREANGGPNFVLGMQDDQGCPFQRLAGGALVRAAHPYRNYQSLVMQHFGLEDTPRLRELMRDTAERTVGQRRHLDAVSDLITHVAIAVCREYYGVDVAPEAEDDFANCSFAASRFMFDPLPNSRFKTLGRAACARINRVIERSIDRAPHDERDTVIRRMVHAGVAREQLRVIVFGMIAGFVPTSTMAAGHTLQVLLERPEAHKAARAAVLADDDVQLERCLFEAMRFKPLLREPLRVCTEPFTLAEGTPFERKIPRGERLIAMTASAMMDERRIPNPTVFDPERPAHQNFVFGTGLHRCIGAPIATVHMLEALRPLLVPRAIRQLKNNGGMKPTCGPFPKHLLVELIR